MDIKRTQKSGYLEPEEVRAIINAVPGVSKHTERDILLLKVIWQTGARVSEAVELMPERVGTTSIVLRNLKQVKRVKQKDGNIQKLPDPNAIKEVEVSTELCRHIKDFCRRNNITRGQYVFQSNWDKKKHLCRKYVHRIMGKASEYAGVFKPGKNNPKTGGRDKGAYPHLFRHANAIFVLDQIGDPTIAQHQLGHSNLLTTLAYIPAVQRRAKRRIKDIKW